MNDEVASSDSPTLLALRIDECCDEFEAALSAGAEARIEDFLRRMTTDNERSALLKELVPLEIEYRRRRGERLDLAEYPRRFPGEVLSSIVAAIAASSPLEKAVRGVPPSLVQMRVILSVVAGSSKGQSFSFDGLETFIAGRSPQAHLKLPAADKFVSRVHFQLEINPPLCRLTNMSNTNGTLVNGEQVAVADLQDGDIILAGETAIRIAIEPK
jgi:hypothetical protein